MPRAHPSCILGQRVKSEEEVVEVGKRLAHDGLVTIGGLVELHVEVILMYIPLEDAVLGKLGNRHGRAGDVLVGTATVLGADDLAVFDVPHQTVLDMSGSRGKQVAPVFHVSDIHFDTNRFTVVGADIGINDLDGCSIKSLRVVEPERNGSGLAASRVSEKPVMRCFPLGLHPIRPPCLRSVCGNIPDSRRRLDCLAVLGDANAKTGRVRVRVEL